MLITVHPNHAIISSEDVVGTAVFDRDGQRIGEIDHLMIDKKSGKIVSAVMSFGGFLKFGHNHCPLPWEGLAYDRDLGGFRTGANPRDLHDEPEFSDDYGKADERERRTSREDFVPPFWGH